jgi:tripartite-type tricarboxylate transporter receptor subunit TctC
MRKHGWISLLIGMLASVGASASAHAQGYPHRPVKLIAPFPAGSAPDQIARIIAPQLQEALGQPFIVENKTGALGTVGAADAARSAPDGYTLLLGSNTTQAAGVALFKKLPYDPLKDFAPVARLVTTSMILVVRADFPAQSLGDFVRYAKAKPGELTAAYGTAGSQVSIAKLKSLGGFTAVDVPYKGSNLAVADVMAGHVAFTFADFAVALGQIKGGKVKGLGVTSSTRTPLAPDIPAIAEALPGFETILWFGVVAPAGTPRDIVNKLYAVLAQTMAKPEVRARFEALGLDAATMNPEQFADYTRDEIVKWSKEARDAGIQAE